MATLPRYEQMGVQYADLPRISTAPQQVAAEGFSRLSQSLDRMVGFMQTELETEAKKAARKYAVENPKTKEQIDTALREGRGLKIEGAGRIFQETYEETQGALLASQLQAEGERKIGTALAKIKAGGQINLQQTQADLKDMIDGYASTVTALDPERSIKLRAALTLAGNTLFETAAGEAQKREMAALKAEVTDAVIESAPLLESTIAKAGTIDPTTGKPINVEEVIEVYRRKLYVYIERTGDDEPRRIFNTIVANAKIGAVVSSVVSPSTTPAEAMSKLNFNELGGMSPVFAGLVEADKQKVRDGVMKYYADKSQAQDIDNRRLKELNRSIGIGDRERFYRGEISRDVLVSRLRALDDITPEELKGLMTDKPDEFKADDRVIGQLQTAIDLGSVGQNDLDSLARGGKISWKQRNDLSKDLRNKGTDMGRAQTYIRSMLGKRPDAFSIAAPNDARREAEVLAQFIVAENQARQEGKPFNPMAVAESLVKTRMQQSDVAAEAETRRLLRERLKSNGLTPDKENWTDKDLELAGVSDRSQRAAIMRLVNTLRGD